MDKTARAGPGGMADRSGQLIHHAALHGGAVGDELFAEDATRQCRCPEDPIVENATGTMTTVYIDESGHSGDMINSGTGYDFKGQPYFALAGVGLEDDHDWEDRISELRSRHRIPPGELKSKSLTSKPKFSAEVINALLDQQAPLFVELVDKRYFICTCITSFQLLAPCLGYPESVELHFIKNNVADFLHFQASDRVLDTFVASCLAPEDATLRASFASLREMAIQQTYRGDARHIADGIAHMVEVAESEYLEQSATENEPWLRFLPPPDVNKHAKQVWMLPNLTSFTSIYARLNRYYGRRLAGIRLVHDQQLEVESILLQGKAAAENLDKNIDLPYTPQSDYRFEEKASIDFAQSHEAIGVQLADIVAGATMRFFRDSDAATPVSSELREAVMRLISEGDARTGYGLNQVVPTANVLNADFVASASSAKVPRGSR
ncbi:DUF3800 domain-containing protein [Delftia lacustris]|uniref:DUF3800 domain-containing protein n=1 Tax=Delftia lacustris TaxID=558537 RepID=UPI00193B14DA|nr:DUF3800 domain-containing protein [Delftia lacustris]QRI93003.1 DUF3800 domain-containing protein [Delftia lacustris]